MIQVRVVKQMRRSGRTSDRTEVECSTADEGDHRDRSRADNDMESHPSPVPSKIEETRVKEMIR